MRTLPVHVVVGCDQEDAIAQLGPSRGAETMLEVSGSTPPPAADVIRDVEHEVRRALPFDRGALASHANPVLTGASASSVYNRPGGPAAKLLPSDR